MTDKLRELLTDLVNLIALTDADEKAAAESALLAKIEDTETTKKKIEALLNARSDIVTSAQARKILERHEGDLDKSIFSAVIAMPRGV